MIEYLRKRILTSIPDMEKYPSGRRGAPAKGVVRVSVARVQIPAKGVVRVSVARVQIPLSPPIQPK